MMIYSNMITIVSNMFQNGLYCLSETIKCLLFLLKVYNNIESIKTIPSFI
jgi:hypothetical protein